MGLKTDTSPVNERLFKMEVAIKNIASLVTIGNFVVNQLMERKAAVVVTTKATSTEEPKWITGITKNVC